jgi:hypothetical protein
VKTLKPLIVTRPLLNELSTLAAPSMLAAVVKVIGSELGAAFSGTLCSYTAEFKEGAREGDEVHIALEALTGADGDHLFKVYFSKGDTLGRIGTWTVVYADLPPGRPLPWDLAQAAADGRTDHDLWRPETAEATGGLSADGQTLLWLAGQSARAYMKRLDQEFAATTPVADDLDTRIYGGIHVTATMARWPEPGQMLNAAMQYHLPLARQPKAERKMVFNGVWVASAGNSTELLGTFRFTVARLSGQRQSIFPNGTTERR